MAFPSESNQGWPGRKEGGEGRLPVFRVVSFRFGSPRSSFFFFEVEGVRGRGRKKKSFSFFLGFDPFSVFDFWGAKGGALRGGGPRRPAAICEIQIAGSQRATRSEVAKVEKRGERKREERERRSPESLTRRFPPAR